MKNAAKAWSFFCLLLLLCTLKVKGQAVSNLDFSVERGFYTNFFTLALQADEPTATIRYTLDGVAPTVSFGTFYSISEWLYGDRRSFYRKKIPTIVGCRSEPNHLFFTRWTRRFTRRSKQFTHISRSVDAGRPSESSFRRKYFR